MNSFILEGNKTPAELTAARNNYAGVSLNCAERDERDMGRKLVLRVWKGMLWMVLLGMIAVMAALYLPGLMHIKPLVVVSGSMEPAYPVGSVTYVKPVTEQSNQKKSGDEAKQRTDSGTEKIENAFAKGDVITFYAGGSEALVTHRIVSVDRTHRCYVTKGDANEVQDSQTVGFDEVQGYPVLTVPYLGYAASELSSRPGKIIAVIVIVAVFLLLTLTDALVVQEKKGRRERVYVRDLTQ